MMTETPREIAHTKIIDILRDNGILDRKMVADLMPVLDEFAYSRYAEGLAYACSLIESLRAGAHNMEHTAEDILKDLKFKAKL